ERNVSESNDRDRHWRPVVFGVRRRWIGGGCAAGSGSHGRGRAARVIRGLGASASSNRSGAALAVDEPDNRIARARGGGGEPIADARDRNAEDRSGRCGVPGPAGAGGRTALLPGPTPGGGGATGTDRDQVS